MVENDAFLQRIEQCEKRAVAVFLLLGKVLGMAALLVALLLLEGALVKEVWEIKLSSVKVNAESKNPKASPQDKCICPKKMYKGQPLRQMVCTPGRR